MKIYWIRHTQTQTPAGLCYGQTDVGLAPDFERHAIEVKKLIAHRLCIWSSPLSRCRRLAEKIADTQPIQIDHRLIELNFGQWENRFWDDLPPNELENWMQNFVITPPPQGETYHQLANRVYDFRQTLLSVSEPNVAVVTHKGILRALYALLTNTSLENSFDVKLPFGAMIIEDTDNQLFQLWDTRPGNIMLIESSPIKISYRI
jgi:alpha-ribazole phosphatase